MVSAGRSIAAARDAGELFRVDTPDFAEAEFPAAETRSEAVGCVVFWLLRWGRTIPGSFKVWQSDGRIGCTRLDDPSEVLTDSPDVRATLRHLQAPEVRLPTAAPPFCGSCHYHATDAADLERHFSEEHTDPGAGRSAFDFGPIMPTDTL
jgi:hypothetical protein